MAYLPEGTANHNTVPRHYQLFFKRATRGPSCLDRPQEAKKSVSFVILRG
jgi:hypothetical protein